MWSALEYAGHVRDVILVQRDRAVLARVEDRPSFAPMWREHRIEICRYADESPDAVLAYIDMAGALCATVFAGLDAATWARPLVYNYPEPSERDMAWLGRHTVHEGLHHLGDVRRVLVEAGGAA